MNKKEKKKAGLFFGMMALAFLIASTLCEYEEHTESVQTVMREAVVHEVNKINLFGVMDVNPAMISAFTVSGILIVFAIICRIFVIPHFTAVPGKFQLVLETLVGFFDNMAKTNSKRNKFLGAYIFAAGLYIFTGTLFELFGFEAVAENGLKIPLPAPLADINGAIMMGVLSYLVIVSGAIAGHGPKGIIEGLKEFSLPVSLSFRLFGALLSGALVTELVYYYRALNYGLPVLVGLLFTVLHALIQAYVLTMLTSIFYGRLSDNGKEETDNTTEEMINRTMEEKVNA